MSVDVISFGPRDKIYRPPGQHSYTTGQDGVVRVSSISDYTAAPFSQAYVDSLCGKFHIANACNEDAKSIIFKGSAFQGSNKEMYHVEGVLQIYRNSIQFKGVEGMRGLAALTKSIAPLYFGLEQSVHVTVHNAVFTFRLGVALATGRADRFARCIVDALPGVDVIQQPFEEELYVQLKLPAHSPPESLCSHFPEERTPTVVDFKVGARGTVQARFSWTDCPWDQDIENITLAYLDRVAECFSGCC